MLRKREEALHYLLLTKRKETYIKSLKNQDEELTRKIAFDHRTVNEKYFV